ncbi:MAG: NAD(+) synthase [Fibrobacteria bacterium]|nr:NAD(+) synthase [Fibrobacteria bacterium]
MKTSQVIDFISNWLNDYCVKSKLNGFVVGVSGGIDSAVTSTLCAQTGKKVIVINMPINQEPTQYALATNHIKWLQEKFTNVESYEINLSSLFKSLEETLPTDIQDNLTMANSRSRLRMITLYAIATNKHLLVAGTGNKVEDFGVGFYTKYGDGGVDISPIADLTKTQVWDLGKSLSILPEVIKAAPTDGLWGDERTDEDQIGASYPELEWAMEQENNPQKNITARQEEVLLIFQKFNTANKHKMESIPVAKIPKELLI